MAEQPVVVELQVLHGEGEGGDAPVVLRPPERPGYCSHRRTSLDTAARRVYCRDCEVEVDAFGALLKFAQEYDRHRHHIERLRADEKRALSDLEGVKRELRNARARLRRANRGG